MEKEQPFLLDLEEQLACIVECLDNETKENINKLLKKKNKAKIKEWEKWQEQHKNDRVTNQEKLHAMTQTFKWLTPLTVLFCIVAGFLVWPVSPPVSLVLALIAVLSVLALLLSLFDPSEKVNEETTKKTT